MDAAKALQSKHEGGEQSPSLEGKRPKAPPLVSESTQAPNSQSDSVLRALFLEPSEIFSVSWEEKLIYYLLIGKGQFKIDL